VLVYEKVVVLSGTHGVAQNDRDGGRDEGDGRSSAGLIVRYFELDEVQVEVFQGLLSTRHETVGLLREQARDIGAALREAINAPDPDPFAIGELVLSEKAIGDQTRDAQEVFNQGFLDLLTEDQLGRYYALARANRLVPIMRAANDLKLRLIPPESDEGEE